MRGENIVKMTFQTRYGHFRFLLMSFSLTNASAALMNLIIRVFQSYLDSFVIILIDNILVYFKNETDHMGHLRVVLLTLKEHQLFAKYSKGEFLLRSMEFFVISFLVKDLGLIQEKQNQ